MSEAGPSQWPFSNRSIETPGASVATHVSVAKRRKRIAVSDPSKPPVCGWACRATDLFSSAPPPALRRDLRVDVATIFAGKRRI
jgi:hypothetical protein